MAKDQVFCYFCIHAVIEFNKRVLWNYIVNATHLDIKSYQARAVARCLHESVVIDQERCATGRPIERRKDDSRSGSCGHLMSRSRNHSKAP
jgi:hypothetical protein